MATDWQANYGPWALVTGASAGLGAEYARQLAALGLDLVLVARRADRLTALAAELTQQHGIRAEPLPLDLLADDAVERLTELAAGREIGLLVNNAGFAFSGDFLSAPHGTYQRMTRLNCELPVVLSQVFLAPMAARGRGGMVLLASMSSYQATPTMTTYGATKAFDLLLGEGLAVELAGSGVDILTVCPGSTSTEFQSVAGVPDDFIESRHDPADVVRGSLRRLGRRPVYVPGLKNRFLLFAQRFGSRMVAARVAHRLLSRRMR